MEHTASTVSSAAVDSTDTGVSDLSEAGYGPSFSECASSAARHFGGADALTRGLDPSGGGGGGSFTDKHFYDRSSEYVKCDSVTWEDLVKAQRPDVAAAGDAPGAASGLCKFIKDENEASMIMDAPCPSFELSSEMPGDPCCVGDRKLHLGLTEGGSPNFLVDLTPSEHLSTLGQVRADAKTHVPAARWPVAELQYWCPATGATEERFAQSVFDGIPNQVLSQRNPSPFPSFPG